MLLDSGAEEERSARKDVCTSFRVNQQISDPALFPTDEGVECVSVFLVSLCVCAYVCYVYEQCVSFSLPPFLFC